MSDVDNELINDYVKKYYFRARVYSIVLFTIVAVTTQFVQDSTHFIGVSIWWLCQIIGFLTIVYFIWTFHLQKVETFE